MSSTLPLSGCGPVHTTTDADDSSLLCPVCFDLMREAQMIPCGHSFCRECLEAALSLSHVCPKCGCRLDRTAAVGLPNYALDQMAKKKRRARAEAEEERKRRRGKMQQEEEQKSSAGENSRRLLQSMVKY